MMGSPCISACSPWASDADVCSPCDDYTLDVASFDDMLAVASDVLFELSGKRFPGSCQDIVRPCGRTLSRDYGLTGSAYLWAGGCSCNTPRECGCSRVSEITLGGYPVTGIVSVKVADNTNPAWQDGTGTATLATDLYRVDDYRYLVRLPNPDGTTPGWPCCQRIDLAAGQQDTFEVEFTFGQMPPPAGVRAAAALACELYLSCQPEGSAARAKCRLPRRVSTLTRQGVSIAFPGVVDALADDRLGIEEVDLFLQTYNPNRLRQRAHVLNPDIHRRVRRVGT